MAPKYKIGQTIYFMRKYDNNLISSGFIMEIRYNPKVGNGTGTYRVKQNDGRYHYVNFADAYDDPEGLELIYGS